VGAAEKHTMLVQLTAEELAKLVRDSVREELRASHTPASANDGAYLTTKQVAKMLSMSARNVRYMIVKCGLPSRTVGSEYRFSRTEVQEWMDKRRSGST
jgi:excisionase family DNA binding protein